MKITRVKAIQAHPVPEKAYQAKGPFPDHLFRESKIVFDYEPENDENGNNLVGNIWYITQGANANLIVTREEKKDNKKND
jgi:hypothetical protein